MFHDSQLTPIKKRKKFSTGDKLVFNGIDSKNVRNYSACYIVRDIKGSLLGCEFVGDKGNYESLTYLHRNGCRKVKEWPHEND